MQKWGLKDFDTLMQSSRYSKRLRSSLNIHSFADDLMQRMLSMLQPDTYVQPHKHELPDKRELFIIIKGVALFVEYDNNGIIKDYSVLTPGGDFVIAEVSAGIYHSLIALEKDTVLFELKDGPYIASNDKKFAPWAPVEGEEGVIEFMEKVKAHLSIK